MKRLIQTLVAVTVALMVAGGCFSLLWTYARPMADQTYDYSLEWEGEALPADWVYDQKGWTVFTQEDDRNTPLTPDGLGGFSGLDYNGQTFYFSRTLNDAVQSPSLRLNVANRNVVVFLDDEVLYSDVPEADNRIGALTLPMADWDREPLTVTLPPDYLGKTLTIAQSTGTGEFETAELLPVVYPCAVTLYCNYAYESTLVADSFRTAIPATLVFALGVFMLGAFVWRGALERWDGGLLLFALIAFAWMLALTQKPAFSYYYFGETPFDIYALARTSSLALLLLYLGMRGGRGRSLLYLFALLHLGLALPSLGNATGYWITASELCGLGGLLAVLGLGLYWCRRGIAFYHYFAPFYSLSLALLLGGMFGYGALRPDWRAALVTALQTGLADGIFRYPLWTLLQLALVTAATATVIHVVQQAVNRRADARLLLQRGEMAQANYENLRRQSEDIRILRHDFRHHLTALRGLCAEGDLSRVSSYINGLSEENAQSEVADYTVHPAVNTVLTAMLGRARSNGIHIHARINLDKSLSIDDKDLCALLMNLLDNAIDANKKAPPGADRWLEVTMHIKGDYLYIGVENARFAPVQFDAESGLARTTKPGDIHGYGLRSARGICKKYHSTLRLEAPEGSFSASTALLLPKT